MGCVGITRGGKEKENNVDGKKNHNQKQKRMEYCPGTVIMGAAGVGKRAFLKRFNGGLQAAPLIGTPGEVVLEDGERVTFEISNFHDCRVDPDFRHYLENLGLPFARLFLLCYSVADRASFDAEVPRLLEYVSGVRQRLSPAPPCRFLLLGLQCDRPQLERRVSLKEGQAFAAKHGWPFLEVSSLSGHNYLAVFDTLLSLASQVYSLDS